MSKTTMSAHEREEFLADLHVGVIAADRDDITPIEAERVLATRFADARLVEIADVGHLIHYEKPAEAAAAIRSFLA